MLCTQTSNNETTIVDAVLSQKFDPNCTTVCATVYGEEGCGKSTVMNELCHQHDIQKH